MARAPRVEPPPGPGERQKRITLGGKLCDPGEIGDYVYTRRPPLERPWMRSIDLADDPALVVLPLLRKWNWGRPEVDPVLMLGWIGVAFLSGALPWRPAVFVTGDVAFSGIPRFAPQHFARVVIADLLIDEARETARDRAQSAAIARAQMGRRMNHSCTLGPASAA